MSAPESTASRRRFLAGATVVSAGVWAPPVVQSLLAPASAAGTPGPSACRVNGQFISADFNGTPIPDGSWIWFSVVVDTGAVSSPTTIQFIDQFVSFTLLSGPVSVPVPNSTVTFDPAVSVGTVGHGGSGWTVREKGNPSGATFLGGTLWRVPAGGLPGGVKPVTWSGTFLLPPGTTVNWQWRAAVYGPATTPTGNGSLDVTVGASSDSGLQPGTPKAIRSFHTEGARGGGGSNFTGSNSATKRADCP